MFAEPRQSREGGGECGGAALYALCLLPAALALSAVVVDVASWNALRISAQSEADRLAIAAAAELPDWNRAVAVVEGTNGELAGAHATAFAPDNTGGQIGVRVDVEYQPSFAHIVELFAPGPAPLKFSIRRNSIVQRVPTDAILVVADGETLRPRLRFGAAGGEPQLDEPWGAPWSWPAAPYLDCVAPPVLALEPGEWPWWNLWKSDRGKRWMTQSCFNPIFSTLKSAAEDIVRQFAANGRDRLGLIFTPGSDADGEGRGGAFVARSLRGPRRGAVSAGLGADGALSARWEDYREQRDFLGDEACVLFASSLGGSGPLYAGVMDVVPGELGERCAVPLADVRCGGRYHATGNVDPCFFSASLNAQQAVHWHAARLGTPAEPARPHLEAALRRAWSELVSPPTRKESDTERLFRGSLASGAERVVYVLTDTLPAISAGGELATIFDQYRAQHIRLWIFAFAHSGLRPDERDDLLGRVEQWRGELRNRESDGTGAPRLVFADSPEQLLRTVAQVRVLSSRHIAVTK